MNLVLAFAALTACEVPEDSVYFGDSSSSQSGSSSGSSSGGSTDTSGSPGVALITSTSSSIVDYGLTRAIDYRGTIGTVSYGYDVVDSRLVMLAEDSYAVNSSSNVPSGSGYYEGSYRGVVATPNGSSVIRDNIGGTIRINADFGSGTLAGSDGMLSISGRLDSRGIYNGNSTVILESGEVLTGRSEGTAGRSDVNIGFAGTGGDIGYSGGLVSGPFNEN